MRETNRLNRIAAECLRESDGDWEAAALAMRKQIDSKPRLRTELMKPLIAGAIWDRIRFAAHEDRKKCLRPDAGEDNTDGLEAMARRTLLDFQLRGGTRLGDATRPEVTEAADWYGTLARTNGANAAWLKSVARALPDDEKLVSDVLTEDQARRLRTRAEKSSTR
jgi:hypothetical protein